MTVTGADFLRAIAAGTVESSPHLAHLGLRLTHVEPGRVTLEWRPGAELTNRSGVVHGGFIATALDDACGMASGSAAERPTLHLTMNLNVDYLRPVHAGRAYAVTGEVTHGGRTRVLTRAAVTDEEGRLCAQATSSLTPNRAVTP
ncbi:PaaI family thioesterase [Thermoactinospora rubra]|uniref:PaaI family thioesterase n=1 Tax=Thermoactinospora rubra TaxID=1088767 RepID=UPI001301A007|nr:PaaI family thioesterase [Thermoactinospora rubra]